MKSLGHNLLILFAITFTVACFAAPHVFLCVFAPKASATFQGDR